jgi:hypothetical protein
MLIHAGIRIALRQMKVEGQASAALTAWLANFDQAARKTPMTPPFTMTADSGR